MFDQLQFAKHRYEKNLRVFNTTSIEIMKIEYNLLLTKLRLLKKSQKYAIRIPRIKHVNNLIE